METGHSKAFHVADQSLAELLNQAQLSIEAHQPLESSLKSRLAIEMNKLEAKDILLSLLFSHELFAHLILASPKWSSSVNLAYFVKQALFSDHPNALSVLSFLLLSSESPNGIPVKVLLKWMLKAVRNQDFTRLHNPEERLVVLLDYLESKHIPGLASNRVREYLSTKYFGPFLKFGIKNRYTSLVGRLVSKDGGLRQFQPYTDRGIQEMTLRIL